jgi:hypothetical protein
VGRLGLDPGIWPDPLGGAADRHAVRLHEPSRDRGLGARPALEISSLDEKKIGALTIHGSAVVSPN